MGLIVRIETLLAIVCHRIFIIILVEYRLGLLGIQMYHGFKRLLNHTDISFAHLKRQAHAWRRGCAWWLQNSLSFKDASGGMAYLTQMSLMKENKILHLGHFVLITTGMTFQSKQQNNATLTYCNYALETNFNIISIGIQIFHWKNVVCNLPIKLARFGQIGQSWPACVTTALDTWYPNSCVEVEQTLKKVKSK